MSSFVLKILACVFMLIDHIGFSLFQNTDILRSIGRLAFPIFCFQVAIGFQKTKSKEKYILRMLLFTIVSQIPFYLFRSVSLTNPKPMLNVGATLTLGLLSLYSIDKIKNPFLKSITIICIILLSAIIPMDYGWYGVCLITLFYVFRDNKVGIITSFYTLLAVYCCYKKSIFNLPSLLALIPILLYNGKKGPNSKYVFYIFYPLHLLVLFIIKKYSVI